MEYAAFLPLHNAVVNDNEFSKDEFIEFDRNEGAIEINNNTEAGFDIILFGLKTIQSPLLPRVHL